MIYRNTQRFSSDTCRTASRGKILEILLLCQQYRYRVISFGIQLYVITDFWNKIKNLKKCTDLKIRYRSLYLCWCQYWFK
jgi:hypothetical protein